MTSSFLKRMRTDNGKKPVNLGKPINSSLDDISIYVFEDETSGMITSGREGGDDDIYFFGTFEEDQFVPDLVSEENIPANEDLPSSENLSAQTDEITQEVPQDIALTETAPQPEEAKTSSPEDISMEPAKKEELQPSGSSAKQDISDVADAGPVKETINEIIGDEASDPEVKEPAKELREPDTELTEAPVAADLSKDTISLEETIAQEIIEEQRPDEELIEEVSEPVSTMDEAKDKTVSVEDLERLPATATEEVDDSEKENPDSAIPEDPGTIKTTPKEETVSISETVSPAIDQEVEHLPEKSEAFGEEDYFEEDLPSKTVADAPVPPDASDSKDTKKDSGLSSTNKLLLSNRRVVEAPVAEKDFEPLPPASDPFEPEIIEPTGVPAFGERPTPPPVEASSLLAL